MNKSIIFVLILVIFSLNPRALSASEEGLLFYLPFGGEAINAISGTKGDGENISFVEGKSGLGAFFDKGSYLRFPASGNINFRQGTVEFWIKPAWYGDDGGYHYFFAGNITNAANVNSIHVSKKPYEGGVILGQIDSKANAEGIAIEEAAVPKGPNLQSSSVASWRKGEWHHLAFSWDAQKKTLKLYIDGLLLATNDNVSQNAFPSAYESYINIGSSIDEVVFAEGVIDELKIWNYPLADEEIAKTAGLTPLTANSKEAEKSKNLMIYLAIILALLVIWKTIKSMKLKGNSFISRHKF